MTLFTDNHVMKMTSSKRYIDVIQIINTKLFRHEELHTRNQMIQVATTKVKVRHTGTLQPRNNGIRIRSIDANGIAVNLSVCLHNILTKEYGHRAPYAICTKI